DPAGHAAVSGHGHYRGEKCACGNRCETNFHCSPPKMVGLETCPGGCSASLAHRPARVHIRKLVYECEPGPDDAIVGEQTKKGNSCEFPFCGACFPRRSSCTAPCCGNLPGYCPLLPLAAAVAPVFGTLR